MEKKVKVLESSSSQLGDNQVKNINKIILQILNMSFITNSSFF